MRHIEVYYDDISDKYYFFNGVDCILLPGGAGGMEIHGNEYHTPDMALATDLSTHAGLTASVHNFDTSGNAPAQSHDNSKHSASYIVQANAVIPNGVITGATKTKIAYDAKGLVTSGTDATTADIADSTGKRYTTEAQQVILSNTSGTNSGDASGHSALAPINNPTLTGVPAAPTPAARTNTTQLATTAFVLGEGNSICLTSDFTTSSVTPVSTNLTFAIGANAVFVVDVYGTCKKATSATGLKFAIAAPSGCVIKGFQLGGGATLAAALVPSLITAINTLGTALATGTNIEVAFALHFRVVNGATPGSITLQAATVTSNVATVFAGAKMIYNRATQV